jgi:O-antigen/teichoic acid export membrane protein
MSATIDAMSEAAGGESPGLPAGAMLSTAGLGKRALRNTLMVLVARVLSRVVALVTVVLMGHLLADTRFGQLQTAVTYSALASIVADFGFTTLYVREAARRPQLLNHFLNFALSVRVGLTALSAPVLLAGLWFAGLQSLWVPTFALLAVGGYLLVLRSSLYATQRLNFEIAEIVPESLLLLGLVVLGAVIHGDTAYFIWAYAITYAVASVYFLIVVWTRGIARPRPQFDRSLLRPWFVAGAPLAITYLLTTVYFKVDVPILQHFRSYAEVGWYTLAYKPFEALMFIPLTLRSVIFPVLSIYKTSAPERVLATAEKFFKALAIIGWPITVGLFLLTPQVNDLFQLYPQSEAALHILSLAVFFAFIENTFSATFNAIDRQKTYAYIALTGLGVNVVLNVIVIPSFGYIGASWSTVATEVAMVTMGWFVLRARLGTLRIVHVTWRVIAAGLVMGGFVFIVNPHGRIALFLVVAAAAAIYIGCLLLFRCLDAEDWEALRSVRRGRVA